MYTAARWPVRDETIVSIFGWQFADRRVERNITADIDDEPMTAAEARQLAAALIEAADGLEKITGTDSA